MNRRLSALLISITMLFSLTACGGEKGIAVKKEQAFTPKLDTEITATLEIAGFMGNFEALDQVMNGFNEFYPNVTFTYDPNTEFMLPDYIASNSGVDLFMTTDQNIRGADKIDYYVQDHCLDLSAEGLDLSALRPEAVSDCTVDGKLLRLPIAMQTYGIVVNKTLLKNEGLSVPTNYEEFLEIMAALKSKGYIPLQGSEQHLYGDPMLNMANIEELPSVIEGSTNEGYSGIEDVKNMQAELISNGTVSESICDVIMDICNRFGAGEFQNAQEAMEAFKEQEYKEQE